MGSAGNGSGRKARWGVAAGVLAASLLLGFAPLLLLAVAVFGLALPPRRPWVALASAALLALLLAQGLTGGIVVSAVFGWVAALAASFAVVSLLRPSWSFFERALPAVGGALAGVGGWLAASGSWGGLDRGVHRQLEGIASGWHGELASRVADPEVAGQLAAALARVVEWQGATFPALLALYSLVVLALAWWFFVRLDPREARWRGLAPLREFRFNDQLVWLVIAGLLLVLLPVGEPLARAGANLLLFMGGLYVVRGIAILTFMMRGTLPSLLMTGGVLLAALVNPLFLSVPLLVGIGDTWLDVRRRMAASRT